MAAWRRSATSPCRGVPCPRKKLQFGFQVGGEEMRNVMTIAPAADAPARNAVSLSAEGSLETLDHAWPETSGAIRILFVEDDAYYREVLARELAEHGFAIRSFADAASLLASIELAADADVILLY